MNNIICTQKTFHSLFFFSFSQLLDHTRNKATTTLYFTTKGSKHRTINKRKFSYFDNQIDQPRLSASTKISQLMGHQQRLQQPSYSQRLHENWRGTKDICYLHNIQQRLKLLSPNKRIPSQQKYAPAYFRNKVCQVGQITRSTAYQPVLDPHQFSPGWISVSANTLLIQARVFFSKEVLCDHDNVDLHCTMWVLQDTSRGLIKCNITVSKLSNKIKQCQ